MSVYATYLVVTKPIVTIVYPGHAMYSNGSIYNESINCSLFKVRKGFGVWEGSYAINTNYGPELRDCFISVSSTGTFQWSTTWAMWVKAMHCSFFEALIGISSPTTVIASSDSALVLDYRYVASGTLGFIFPVKKGQMWRINAFTNVYNASSGSLLAYHDPYVNPITIQKMVVL
jgi:hypothetical protein